MKNPTTNVDINKKVSAMNYYAYRMMIRENADNHILKCRQLFHQYIVDMYAKIESERLLYIRLNQVKLRSEEYIHLRHAVVNDGNLSELGKMVILPSTFTGSPRHMHEYAQDAMTYVRAYGRPDFFITFACNAAWDEVKELLLTGQSPSDRHDISARYKFDTIANKSLTELGVIAPNKSGNDIFDRDIHRETHFDVNELQTFVRINLPKLVLEQRTAYDTIINAIAKKSCGLYFLDAPGGTGKIFLISIILVTIRSQNNIALTIASSGIAATLLDGGRTAHSALKLPLNMQVIETPTCNISKFSGIGKVLSSCQLIIWDECTMAHKKSLEALNRTLQDLRGNEQLFGGALILLAGDFRQTLPVIPRSTPADGLNACLKSSMLWRYVEKISLKTNMRIQLQQDESSERFAKQLLDIVNGKMEIDESTHTLLNYQKTFVTL
ncbi:ATP-dependent DNA helicase [Trichonephila clavipes]|nr:ATP-dependent DNA helicase [Trichonephila clavipes]